MCHVDSSYMCLGSMTICLVSLVFMAYSLVVGGDGPVWLFMAAAFTAMFGLFLGYFFAVLKEIRLAEEKYHCVDNNLNE